MPRKPKSVPELLLPRNERALRLLARSIIMAHPDTEGRSDENRVGQVVALLLGRKPPAGPSQVDRDDLLGMMAFDYSVQVYSEGRDDVTPTEIARKLVEYHPTASKLAHRDAIVRNLVRKFKENAVNLLRDHSYDADAGPDVAEMMWPVLEGLEKLEVKIEPHVIPPGYRQGK
ncbi:hypothetical protein [Aureimonas sp. AU22]|uniref:hypothetical protein n=1 Tax=Aureimonas sp. AU22 TaxID=1638162 RepID=UPI00178CD030|nr:hypothetical protein [Aureimonas sp. AU22]